MSDLIPNLDFSDGLQEAMRARLANHPWFATTNKPGQLDIVTEDDGDVIKKLDATLAKLGMGVLIGTPEFSTDSPNAPFYFDDVLIEISIVENGIVNRSKTGFGRSVAKVAFAVYCMFANWTPPGTRHCLYPDRKPITSDKTLKAPNRIVRMHTSVTLVPTELNLTPTTRP